MIVGVIGLGSIGMRHAKNLLAMGHEVYGMDSDIGKIGELIKLGGYNADGDKKPYLGINAMVIASPTHLHFAHAYGELRWPSSKPVLIEKPIGRSLVETQTLLDMAKDYDVQVMVGNNMRYHPVVKVVKERMWELGGHYTSAWFAIKQKNTKYTDPVVLNWGAHEVDLALYLLGKMSKVESAKCSQNEASMILRGAAGRQLVHVDLDYLTEPWERYFTIHGPDASIHADLENFVVHIFSRQGREIIAVEGSHEQTYVDEMEEFMRRVEGRPPDGIGATGEEGLSCLKLLLEAQK